MDMSTRKKTLRKMLSVIMVMVMLFSMSMPVFAETVAVNVTGTFRQSDARAMLDTINSFRRESPSCASSDDSTQEQYKYDHDLKYDYTLEKAAMQRAAEIAVSFSHTRPNGADCFTVSRELNYEGFHAGENIAYNSSGAARAFVQWKEDGLPYSGQGHRRNMLGKFTHIGIAVFKVGGTYYCVQEFGYYGDDKKTAVNDSETSVPVNVDTNSISVSGSISCDVSSVSMTVGSTKALPNAQLYLTAGRVKSPSNAKVTFKSSDSNGLAISGSNMTAKKVGTYILTASAVYGGKTVSEDITVTVSKGSLNSGKITLSQTAYTYDGNEKKPKATVTVGGNTLTENVDYTLSYSPSTTDAGTVTVTAEGKNNYGGKLTASYTIAAADASKAVVKLSYTETDYTGKALTPSVTSVTLNGKTIPASNYTVSYSDNINVGKATVTVTFKNNYSGKATANFTINKKKIPLVAVKSDIIGGRNADGAIALSDASVKIVSISDPETSVTAKVDGSKFTASIPEGDFKMTVSKAGYITREYTLNTKTMSSFTAEIHQQGDVNGDGYVDVIDATRLLTHIRRLDKLTDEYDLKVADFNQANGIDVIDVTDLILRVRRIQ